MYIHHLCEALSRNTYCLKKIRGKNGKQRKGKKKSLKLFSRFVALKTKQKTQTFFFSEPRSAEGDKSISVFCWFVCRCFKTLLVYASGRAGCWGQRDRRPPVPPLPDSAEVWAAGPASEPLAPPPGRWPRPPGCWPRLLGRQLEAAAAPFGGDHQLPGSRSPLGPAHAFTN